MRPARPRRGSLFFGFRSVRQILPEGWFEEPWPDELEPFELADVTHLPYAKYLDWRLNDAWIYDLRLSEREVGLTCADYEAWVLNMGMTGRGGVEELNRVHFRFEGVREIKVWRADRYEGDLRFVRSAWKNAGKRATDVQRIFTLRATDGWAGFLLLYAARPYRLHGPDTLENPGMDYLVVGLDCERVSLRDTVREAFLTRFGPEGAAVYDRFDAERSGPEYPYIQDCRELARRLGWTQTPDRPASS